MGNAEYMGSRSKASRPPPWPTKLTPTPTSNSTRSPRPPTSPPTRSNASRTASTSSTPRSRTSFSADDLDEILRAMGFRPSPEELMDIPTEIDEDGSGEIEFGEFCQLCATFLVEDPDLETMKRELKDAF